jgi:hypothetical protein
MPYQPKSADAVKERLIARTQFGSKPRSIHIEVDRLARATPTAAGLFQPLASFPPSGHVAAISMGCPALLAYRYRRAERLEANPWNLIRVMPAEGSLR